MWNATLYNMHKSRRHSQMVPNIHAVKGLSRRLFVERCFSHTFTRNVQYYLSTANLSFPQPRSRYSAHVNTVPTHTVTNSCLEVTTNISKPPLGHSNTFFMSHNWPKNPSLHSACIGTILRPSVAKGSAGTFTWSCPAPSEQPSEQLGAHSPNSRHAAKTMCG